MNRILHSLFFIAFYFLLPNLLFAMTDTVTNSERIEIGVFDPSGKTAHLVETIGKPCIQLSDLNTFEGKLLIIGPNCLNMDEISLLKSMVRRGINILCLKQDILPSGALSGLQPVYGTFTVTEAMVVSPLHPILSGVDKWNRCGTMTNLILSMPDKGNFRPIIASEDEVLLMEILCGQGEFVFCQLDVFEQETNILFKNMLEYTMNYKGKIVNSAVYSHPKSKAMEIFNAVGIPGPRNPLKFNKFSIALVCLDEKFIKLISIINKDFSSQLMEFLQNGGKILILNLTPQILPLVKEIFPDGIEIKETEENQKIIVADDPLLWGINKSKLRLNKYILTNSKQDNVAEILVEPGIISRLQIGNGEIIICQLNLEDNPDEIGILLQILINMGVMLL